MFTAFTTLIRRRFIRDTFYMYTSSLVNGASLFFVNVALGRSFSKEWFATFTLSLLVLSTVAEMSDLGLNGGLLRFAPFYIAQNQLNKLKQLVKTIWRWRVSMSITLTIFGALSSYFIARYIFKQPSIGPYLAVSFFGVGGVILLGFVSTYLQASQRFFYNAGVQTLKGTLRLFFVLLLILIKVKSLYFYLGVYIGVPWLLFFLNYRVLPAGFRAVVIDKETKKDINSQLAKFSFWLTIWSLFSILASRVDQVMLSRFLGLEQVALYAAAYQLIQLYPIVSQSIGAVLGPRISGVATKDELTLMLRRSMKWILCVVVIGSVIVYPSKYLITLFFGHSFDASLPVYLILAYSLVFNILVIPFSQVITAFNRTDLMAYSGIIQSLVNLGGGVVLIPRFGLMGAGYTFMFGILVSVIYNIVNSLYLLKKVEITIR